MTVRDAVREAQRRLAALDAAHRKATERLAQATKRRSEVLAAEDAKVVDAATGVETAVTAMAEAVGVELAATLCGITAAEVRRLAKAHTPTGGPTSRSASPSTPGRPAAAGAATTGAATTKAASTSAATTSTTTGQVGR